MPELICYHCLVKLRDEFYRCQALYRELQVKVTNQQLNWFAPTSRPVSSSGAACRAAKHHELPLDSEAHYRSALDDLNQARAAWVSAVPIRKDDVSQGRCCSRCGGVTLR